MRTFVLALVVASLTACGRGGQELRQPSPPPDPAPLTEDVPADVTLRGRLDVVTVKDEGIEVPGSFTGLAGRVRMADTETWRGVRGAGTVALASWDSKLELRDERVRNTFFNAPARPEAGFELTSIAGLPGGGLAEGAQAEATVSGKVTLGVSSQAVTGPVLVSRVGPQSWTVTSTSPLTVSIAALGLGEGLAKLIAECGHQALADEVRVSLHLELGDMPTPPAPPPPETP